MIHFHSFQGTITAMQDINGGQGGQPTGCDKLIRVEDEAGAIVNFVVTPTTYFVDHLPVSVGDTVTGFYDQHAPAILIYPPQYEALIMVKESPGQHVKVDY